MDTDDTTAMLRTLLQIAKNLERAAIAVEALAAEKMRAAA